MSYLIRFIIYFEIKNPAKTSAIPIILLASMFDIAYLISPSRRRLKLSRVKDEKVVKPPRMPTNTKVLILGDIFSISKKPQRRPIAKEPARFTNKVPHGKMPSRTLYVNPDNE